MAKWTGTLKVEWEGKTFRITRKDTREETPEQIRGHLDRMYYDPNKTGVLENWGIKEMK